ncbi:MAG: immune inhibitor A [Roseiflexaceae bacterium]
MRPRFLLTGALSLLLCGCTLTAPPQPTPTPAASAPTTLPKQPEATTPAPTITPPTPAATSPTDAPVADGALPDQTLALLDRTTGQPRDQLALAAAFGRLGDSPEPTPASPPALNLGDSARFSVSDQSSNTQREVTAELRYIGQKLLMYVDSSLSIDQDALERSARTFEERIYPRNHALFGVETSPGVDGDPRVVVLNTILSGGVVGYFSSADAVPRAANRFSNQRDMFVIDASRLPLGSDSYDSTLAHEFQHMIHWNEQRRSPTWFNEGMSTIAEDQNGYVSQGRTRTYLADPDLQLTGWSSSGNVLAHYGAANLFLRYFYEQYAQQDGLAALIQADAGNQLEVFTKLAAQKRPDIRDFADLAADWAIANLLNDPQIDGGRYAYSLLPETVAAPPAPAGSGSGTVSQFGADYLELPRGPATLSFNGETTVSLTGTEPVGGRYAWWSGRGDDNMATLTRAFDLRNARDPVLQFALWHELETGWDYGYITVSTDGGTTWAALKGSTTTTSDPQGNNIGGEALTGVSGASPDTGTDQGLRGQWIDEQVDLAAYAGREILVRFWVVNDDAYNAPGLLIDNIRLQAIGYTDDVEGGDGGWQAQGFARVGGDLPQRWTLRLVRRSTAGVTVEPVAVDQNGNAEVALAEGEQGTLLIMGSTPHTSEPGRYRYEIK